MSLQLSVLQIATSSCATWLILVIRHENETTRYPFLLLLQIMCFYVILSLLRGSCDCVIQCNYAYTQKNTSHTNLIQTLEQTVTHVSTGKKI